MIFSASATHALRAMTHLAANPQVEAKLGRELAAEIELPTHYLAKVLATLARAGLLLATRGVRGGYRLARAPREILLLEIVEPFEGKRVRSGCLLQPDRACRDEAACSAHAEWSKVKATYLGFLERTTLADIQGRDAPGMPAAPTPGRVRQRRGGSRKRRRGA
jgi:Rrf2 family iron-sulfur cluster assembly transcriptional regulator